MQKEHWYCRAITLGVGRIGYQCPLKGLTLNSLQ